jgi:hypothetical protein
MENAGDVIGSLIGANNLTDLVGTMSNFIKQADSISKEATRQGATIASVADSLGPELGKLSGRNEELTNALEMLDAGLSINNEQVRLLSLQTRAAGGDSRILQQTFRRLVVTGGANNAELSDMSVRLARMRDTFKMSTDKLIGAMADLADNLDLAFFGVTKEFSLAIASLEGKFGAGAGDPFKRLTDQLMNPDFFGRALQFGLQDEIDVLTSQTATQEEIQQALMSVVATMKPQIDIMRGTLGGMGSQTVALQRLGDYFGGKDFVTTIEQLSKMTPLEKPGIEGAKAEDPFKNLENALNQATTYLQDLASKVVPFLVEHIGILVKTLLFVGSQIIVGSLVRSMGTMATSLRSNSIYLRALGKSIGGIGSAISMVGRGLGMFSRLLGFVGRFLGPIGILVSLLMTFLPEILNFFSDEETSKDDQGDEAKKQAAAEERKRLAEERDRLSRSAQEALNYKTNDYLQLQSKSLDDTLRSIQLGNTNSAEALGLQEQQVDLLRMLIGVVQNNTNRGQAPIPAGVRR